MSFTIQDVKQYDNLTIMQIYLSQKKSFDYISGRAASLKNYLEINEVTESGSVNEILVANKSNNFIFLLDGDILIGAKQNRVVNTSILLAPFSKTHLPVSCIERDRWHHSSENFHFSDNIIPNSIRANKSFSVNEELESSRSFHADQSKVWSDIESESIEYNTFSKTSDLNEMIELKKRNTSEEINSIKPNKKSNGVILFKDDKIFSADFFGKKTIYSEYFNKIIIDTFTEKQKINKLDLKDISSEKLVSKANKFFKKLKGLKYKKYKSVGVGVEFRGLTKKYSVTQLKHEKYLFHLSALRNNH